eukprot:8908573-Lingulodinium_polyedra.AAC.1
MLVCMCWQPKRSIQLPAARSLSGYLQGSANAVPGHPGVSGFSGFAQGCADAFPGHMPTEFPGFYERAPRAFPG